MIVKVNVTLKSLNGEVLKDRDEKNEVVDATLKTAMINALLTLVERDRGIEKANKYELAVRIFKNDEVELEVEEIALIKERVGEVFPPLIVGQVFNILENK